MLRLYSIHGCEAHLEAVESGPWKGCWEVKSLHTKEQFRRAGLATQLMLEIIEDADAQGVKLHLTARSVGGEVAAEVLRKFYEEFGFENYPGMGRAQMFSMLRVPAKRDLKLLS